jgi:SpoVK/Ycf46/Vps4 family AAA+-type ATPase
LLRVDLGGLKSKFVGESEGNLRKAFEVIAAIGRCVVWFDEIEKALQGATSGSADGGVSSDALGAILGWMQERQGDAFVVATANDVEGLPPELLRKGRFDELFFVDVPTVSERVSVLNAAISNATKGGTVTFAIKHAEVCAACDGFTGAEIAAIVPDAMFTAFNDGARDVSTDDLVAAAKTVVPLVKTAAEKIERLRKWASGRARPAGKIEVEAKSKQARALDIA